MLSRMAMIAVAVWALAGCDAGAPSGNDDVDEGPPVVIGMDGPADEVQLLRLQKNAVGRYNAAINDIQKQQAKDDWQKAACALRTKPAFSKWIGSVVDIGAPGIIKGASISIDLGQGVSVGPDIADRIDPGTPLYNAISNMALGTRVRFSGEFVPDAFTGCTMQPIGLGSNELMKPSFSIKLTAIVADDDIPMSTPSD